MSQMKLSEIWDKADKQIKQLHNRFGSRTEKAACALGAISFFETKNEFLCESIPAWQSKGLVKFERKYGAITYLNDEKGWTFKQFADAARAIGE